jgi:hypothetical protein
VGHAQQRIPHLAFELLDSERLGQAVVDLVEEAAGTTPGAVRNTNGITRPSTIERSRSHHGRPSSAGSVTADRITRGGAFTADAIAPCASAATFTR